MKPFLSGRQQVSIAPLKSLDAPLSKQAGIRVLGHDHPAHPSSDKPDSSAQPAVECIRQGDKVVRLVVTCTCGERIEIDCLY